MYLKRSRSRAGAPADRNARQPRRLGRITGFAGALVSAVIVLSAVPGAAQAATASAPSASLAFAAARVSSGTRPVLTFITSDIPAGSVVYVQMTAGTGHSWQDVGRIRLGSGAVRLPADPAGRYEYRILVTQGGASIATSAPASLAVSGTPRTAASGSGCTACDIASYAIPWLAPIVAPVIENVVEQLGSALLAFLALAFG
jgi:hypothetical protein